VTSSAKAPAWRVWRAPRESLAQGTQAADPGEVATKVGLELKLFDSDDLIS
jgi:hypothetical protein